ncbi:MAG: class I SAM-dependent methyltransferase [Sphingobacteriales bacterium]|nr:MAG: class I SAM-dependent methyltransferase [Sphingobacteriales bacterium]
MRDSKVPVFFSSHAISSVLKGSCFISLIASACCSGAISLSILRQVSQVERYKIVLSCNFISGTKIVVPPANGNDASSQSRRNIRTSKCKYVMETKGDHFSRQADVYAAFRPNYPGELYDFMFSISPGFERAWDCGTGNGQVARVLAGKFARVDATDISAAQLMHAPLLDNVHYEKVRAEQTGFPNAAFDLITVATAVHWFDFEDFYREVRRVGGKDAVIAVWTYVPFHCSPEIDAIVNDLSKIKLKKYWPEGRHYLEDGYKTIPFPFREIAVPEFSIDVDWTMQQLLGYLDSWSSVQAYKNMHQHSPVDGIIQDIEKAWGVSETRRFLFPIYMRAGYIHGAPSKS